MTEMLIIKKLATDKSFFATVFGDILPSDFEKIENQNLLIAVQELYKTYKKPPSLDELEIYIDSTSSIKVNLKALMRQSLKEIRALNETISDDILIDMTEKFIKNKRFKDLLIKGVEVLDGSSKKESIESLSEESNNIRKLSFKKSAGLDYIRDAEKNFLEYAKVESDGIKAPLEIINITTGGGFRPGSLFVVGAASNSGKTIFVTNIAGYAASQGKNVAVFHMEETELDIRERLDAYLLGKTTEEIRRLSSELKTPFEHLISKGFGNIKIKSYGPNSASCVNYQAQLDEWKLQDGFVPDIIVHDSITITKPNINQDNLYSRGKSVSEELKSLGVNNNVPVVTAVQLGRSSFKASVVGMEDVAESIAISQVATAMIGVVGDEHRPDIRICSILKSRKTNKDKFKPMIVNVDTDKQTLSDLSESDKRIYIKAEQKEVLNSMNEIVETGTKLEKEPEKGKSILDSFLK